MWPVFIPLFAGTAILVVLLAIPLIRRRVPPNDAYGLRVSATFADKEVWYEANARSGRDLLNLGLLLLILALILPLTGLSEEAYSLGWSIAAVIGALIMAGVGWRRANRLLRERQRDTDA